MLTLVTGGAGFLGSHLVNSLIDDGNDVIVMDNLSTGQVRNLEHAISTGRATFVFADVATTTERLTAMIAEATGRRPLERIYHLASPASPEAYGNHPWETLAVNGLATMSLVDIALEMKARFLFASTSEIYGDPLVHPQPESYFGNVDPIGPRSCYDEGKRFGEAAVAAGVRSRGLDGRLVRFFNCYGPQMEEGDGRLIPSLLEALAAKKPMPIHGTGKQTRSMTYVADAVAMLKLVMERPQSHLQPVNIGNDDERSILQIAQALALVAGVPFEAEYLSPREADPQRRKPVLDVAKSYGWTPTTSLEDGLRETFRWYTKDRHAFA